MVAQKRKGIATNEIFYIVIGIAVVALIVLLVVSYTGQAKTSGSCRIEEDKYCEKWAAEDGDFTDSTKPSTKPPAGCNTDPSKNLCKSRGYT